MANEYLDDLEFTDTGNWNAAKIYSEAMITRFLVEASDYERIAKFGTSDFEMSYLLSSQDRIQRRLDGMEWMIEALLKTVDNSYFAIKQKDKPSFLNYRKNIEEIQKLFDSVKTKKQKYNSFTIEIDEEKFKEMLTNLTRIRREMMSQLNKADLIFSHREEFDPAKFKQQVMDRLVNEG